jgi:hypothetical protein
MNIFPLDDISDKNVKYHLSHRVLHVSPVFITETVIYISDPEREGQP